MALSLLAGPSTREIDKNDTYRYCSFDTDAQTGVADGSLQTAIENYDSTGNVTSYGNNVMFSKDGKTLDVLVDVTNGWIPTFARANQPLLISFR